MHWEISSSEAINPIQHPKSTYSHILFSCLIDSLDLLDPFYFIFLKNSQHNVFIAWVSTIAGINANDFMMPKSWIRTTVIFIKTMCYQTKKQGHAKTWPVSCLQISLSSTSRWGHSISEFLVKLNDMFMIQISILGCQQSVCWWSYQGSWWAVAVCWFASKNNYLCEIQNTMLMVKISWVFSWLPLIERMKLVVISQVKSTNIYL